MSLWWEWVKVRRQASVKNAEALERMEKVDTLVIDKTEH